MLKRKIDIFLDEWRNRKHSPLITSPPHTRDFSCELGGFIFESYLRMV